MKDRRKPNHELVFQRYSDGIGFNSKMNLDAEVENNENFFIGKQWEGVETNGLPAPVFNFLKRVTLFTVASTTTDNLKLHAAPLGNKGARKNHYKTTNIINNEFEALFENNSIVDLMREAMRNAAVDGDGCTYTYWDADIETGQNAKGGIVTEVIENTRVFFGNPNDRRVQRQPYIIVERRLMLDDAKDKAEDKGKDPNEVKSDAGERKLSASEMLTDNRVTELLYFYRNKETNTIWLYDCFRGMELEHKDLKLKLYPITWLNWDYRQDNYHGQALISGLIPNQEFVNKLFAMSMISLMTTAYPKIVYDKTRIKNWSNQVGAAIGINGGDVNSVAKIIDPAQISPQISEFIKLAVDYTQTFLGATPAALGDTRPDNTSAIVALQRASATPNELTKQNYYRTIEELGRIYLDFMANYYGKRLGEVAVPDDIDPVLAQFAGVNPGEIIEEEFDFASLKELPMSIKLDVGASAYWSEIASVQTLDNLLMQDKISLADYLERIPDGYIQHRQELLEKIQKQGAMPAASVQPPSAPMMESGQPMAIPEGSGNGQLQRAIARGAEV